MIVTAAYKNDTSVQHRPGLTPYKLSMAIFIKGPISRTAFKLYEIYVILPPDPLPCGGKENDFSPLLEDIPQAHAPL
jgi:hypothetical protein